MVINKTIKNLGIYIKPCNIILMENYKKFSKFFLPGGYKNLLTYDAIKCH